MTYAVEFNFEGPSWSWLHGNWNYNYLCNQSLWVWIDTLCEFVSEVGGFLQVLWFLTNKTDRHDITEILLNVGLNTITLTL